MIQILQSNSGAERLSAAHQFIQSYPAGTELLLVGPTREAIDDLVRDVSIAAGATFGLSRATLTELAWRLAAAELARSGLAPATSLGAEAVVARAVFEARERDGLGYFAPVAGCPGFARALASTLQELRLAGIDPAPLATLPRPGSDLAGLLRHFEDQITQASIADRAVLFRTATDVVRAGKAGPLARFPILLLDVPIRSHAERDLIAALAEQSPRIFVTVPAGDVRTLAALDAVVRSPLAQTQIRPAPVAKNPKDNLSPDSSSTLSRLGAYLFSAAQPPAGRADEQVCFFSAPGEGRECVEIARGILEEASRGIRFDRMAVLLRAPETYSALLEHALQRARIPAYFARGTKRPDASGRALLALLICAGEGLSAKRFAEYLSLGQVPALDAAGAPPTDRKVWVGPDDEMLGPAAERAAAQPEPPDDGADAAPAADSDDTPVVAGTLRAPWKWEQLLVDAAVIGGKDRWVRRLDGFEAELRLRLGEEASEEPESARAAAIERDLTNLGHLRRFALPTIAALAAFPQAATWGDWLDAFDALAPMVLRRSERVLAVLAELRPMAPIGPVALDEVRNVLSERLSTLEQEPPDRRYGRVFVAPLEQARGRSFDVVFVPGLAERIFPRKPHEDPMLLDALRVELGSDLETQDARVRHERLLLRLGAGAARTRLYLSYPRLELEESRPRVPSFYALDVERAITGRIPDFEALEREAERVSDARLAWPAPRDPARAIDDLEHDLAVLGDLFHKARSSDVRGRARYLLELNPSLGRSLRSRWVRWEERRWSHFDGLTRSSKATAAALSPHRLAARAYSVSALQKFATCPYQFLLSAIYRLEPREEAAPLEQLDPLTRGKLFHQVQAELMREIERSGSLPVSPSTLPSARTKLDETLDRVAGEYWEDLAPAIPRVWQDAIEAMRVDLRVWLERMAHAEGDWEPIRFEFGFGLPVRNDAGFDPRSLAEPVTLPSGCRLHGSVDFIEQKRGTNELRVTDHKTGKDRTKPALIVGGGEVLQPVLYSLAVEAAMEQPVTEARLVFCTSVGGFTERKVPMDEEARHSAKEVLEIIDRAIETGFLAPAPRKEACEWCDFREVCGPHEEIRVRRKDDEKLRDLLVLREKR